MKLEVLNTNTLAWKPEAEEDENGDIHQTSFIVKAEIATDAAGNYAGPHSTVQGYKAATGSSRTETTPWDPFMREGRLPIRDGEAPISEDVDFTLVKTLTTRLRGHSAENGLREVQRLCDMGHRPARIAHGRDINHCAECNATDVLGPSPETTEEAYVWDEVFVCQYCDGLVHSKCMNAHRQKHAMRNLCYGIRADMEKAAKRTEAEQEDALRLDRRKRSHRDETRQRREEQGESSLDEGLEVALRCSACGDYDCFRGTEDCKHIHRAETLHSLILALDMNDGATSSLMSGSGPESEQLKGFEAILDERQAWVDARDAGKLHARKRKKSRHGVGQGQTVSPETLLEQKGGVGYRSRRPGCLHMLLS